MSWLVEELRAEAVVGGPEHARERFDPVVEGLRIDDEPLAPHDLHRPLERQVVGVLRDGDGDCEREAVAPAGHETARNGRGLDALAALAAVLLPEVLPDHELARDDVDLFALLCFGRSSL